MDDKIKRALVAFLLQFPSAQPSSCFSTSPCTVLPVSTNVFYFYTNFISSTPLLRIFYSWSKHKRSRPTTILGEPGRGLAHPRGMYYNGKEGRKEPLLITSYNTGRACHILISSAERVIKATRCNWLLATTNVDFARTLHNFRLTDSIFESVRRLLSWSGQQHTNVLASLRPAYITQLLGVSRQIIRHLGVGRLMYARHKPQARR